MLHEVKGKLAKLLATENLIIEHRAVETAQFDVVRRVLTLPIWKFRSVDVYISWLLMRLVMLCLLILETGR